MVTKCTIAQNQKLQKSEHGYNNKQAAKEMLSDEKYALLFENGLQDLCTSNEAYDCLLLLKLFYCTYIYWVLIQNCLIPSLTHNSVLLQEVCIAPVLLEFFFSDLVVYGFSQSENAS